MFSRLQILPVRKLVIRWATFLGLLVVGVGCDRNALNPTPVQPFANDVSKSEKPPVVDPVVAEARRQIGVTTVYDPSYVGLAYPGGDVPADRGVCTDVVIRALRIARGLDLQQLVHEDMRSAFDEYPKNWGLKKTDRNIDHRRVPNLRRYFERQGFTVKTKAEKPEYKPGDLVTCRVGNRPHIMIVSDRKMPDGTPLIIHNIGSGTKEEDRLLQFEITGHYRLPAASQSTKQN